MAGDAYCIQNEFGLPEQPERDQVPAMLVVHDVGPRVGDPWYPFERSHIIFLHVVVDKPLRTV